MGGLIALYHGVNYIIVSNIKPINQIVATGLPVTSEWTEISPALPMKVEKQIQRLFLIIDDYRFDDLDDHWQLRLSNGIIIKPEIQILDEFGKVYDLQDGTRVGNSIGFSPKRKNTGFNTFPADRTYTKIRIRSDEPFQCSKMIWSNKNLK